jgi:hypothetical protein
MRTVLISCDRTEAKMPDPIGEDQIDLNGEDDPELAPNWSEITIRTLKTNPDYAQAVTDLQQQIAQIVEEAAKRGMDPQEAQALAAAELGSVDVPPFMLDVQTYHVGSLSALRPVLRALGADGGA